MNDGFETKIEDLEGFWEMVSYQIEDVHHTFDEIESMRQNNWTVVPEAEIQHHEVNGMSFMSIYSPHDISRFQKLSQRRRKVQPLQ